MNYKLQELYNKTLDFVGIAHKEQKVPGKNYSYIVHLSNVCMEVLYAGRNNKNLDEELMLQCALLHDVIEDTSLTYEEVAKEFGEELAKGVLALTKKEGLEKKEAMIDSLKRIKVEKKEIWVVKMGDRITNLQKPPLHWNKEKIRFYIEQANLIYEELKDADKYIAERLKWKIEEYSNINLQ